MNSSFTARWNEALLDETYQRWCDDPQSVDAGWAAFFEGFELGCARPVAKAGTEPAAQAGPGSRKDLAVETKTEGLVYAYRTIGHSIAKLDPLAEAPRENPLLELKELGFGEEDLDRVVRSKFFRDGKEMKLRDMIAELREIYSDTIGAEFMHIQNPATRNWVRDRLENLPVTPKHDADLHKNYLRRLLKAEEFENFLHTRYQGNKRFSLEGGEGLMVALNAALDDCEKHNVKEIVMGMAHRGRLNVLANFLHKPFSLIFNEFSENYVPDSVAGSGDVKYHL
ncbi:MAG: 2-oxoglutarate dehydrogenase E1 subunit family protein, partial [Chthoniobacterales bacterium]